jgi:hypothetical protein
MTRRLDGKGQPRLILSLFFFVLFGQIAIQYGTWFLPSSEHLRPVEGEWKYCSVTTKSTLLPIGQLPSKLACDWHSILMPGRLKIEDFPNQVIAFQKQVVLPDICVQKSCSFLFPTVTDSGFFYVGDALVGQVGTPGTDQKSYVQAYPIRFQIPAHLTDTKTSLTYLAYASQSLDRGLLRGPMVIGETNLASVTQEIIVAGNIVNPILSGWGLILLSVFVLSLPYSDRAEKRFSLAFLGYSLMSLIYAISLTRLPRQHLGGAAGCLKKSESWYVAPLLAFETYPIT